MDIISSKWFNVICVPVLFVLIGALANALGRRDGDKSPLRNVWAVGTSVILMSFGSVFSDMRLANSESLSDYLFWVIAIIILLFISMHQDRYKSWIHDNDGNPTDKKHMFWGVIIPNLVSVSVFYSYRISMGGYQ